MNTILLKGKPVSEGLKEQLKKRIDDLSLVGISPKLAAILVGDDPASHVYVRNKSRIFEQLNCKSHTYRIPGDVDETPIINLIEKLNNDITIHGILVQLPLPKHLDSQKILQSVLPLKDVDGFHPYNLGSLFSGEPRYIPCTPAGILEILKYYNIPVSGRHVVIVGRSNIVGKPMFALLVQKFEIGNATVTICHTGTKDLKTYTTQADIIIAAAGCQHMINGDMIKKGVNIIDVGINRVQDDSKKGYHLVGDVDIESVLGIANSITPVPGGVGPMTIIMLLFNTVVSAEKFRKLEVVV